MFPDFGGGVDFSDVEGHLEQVGGVGAVEPGVEIVLLFGLFEPVNLRLKSFPSLNHLGVLSSN